MAATTLTVKVVDFKRGLAHIKRQGGRFDGTTKLWTVTVNPDVDGGGWVNAPRAYGLQIVSKGSDAAKPTDTATCTLWTEDQGCPLHGEVCHA